jgi:4-alpha-glucanotransferase
MWAVAELDDVLLELAQAYGIATEYWDWQGHHVAVDADTVIAVLAGLDVDASTPELAWEAVHAHHREPWTRMLPRCVATRERRPYVISVHVTDGDPVDIWIELETGGRRGLRQLENWNPPREIGDRWIGEASFEIPGDLPLGYHTVRARSGGREAEMPLIITPAWLGLPTGLGQRRAWGLATQLYSVRSHDSWGVGDLVDLTDLAVWSGGEHGADYILVNPLHAAEPVPPLEPSPYLPSTRRFFNPLYLRPERIPEFVHLDDTQRANVTELRAGLDAAAARDTIDRDAAWTAKRAALKIVFSVPRSPGRQLAFQAFRRRAGEGLERFAQWAVLSERHGPHFDEWPTELQHPGSAQVAEFTALHGEEIDFVCWLQWVLDEQLASTQLAGEQAGMALGVMHDLAVGVHPYGADAWALRDTYAQGISVGAPPDPYNQNGQNWSQPPWRPDRLAEQAYAPYREMVRTILRHAGGIRVDHVSGLFRLWWIPAGAGPTKGTYVRNDHEALVGILALEAHRAGAVVVGEDLGTVEPWVRDHLRERGILGTSILWFEFDFHGDGSPLAPEQWRELCLASVTTHDLPPTAGYLAGDHVRLRDRLGVLTRPLAEELAVDEAERQAWLDNLRSRGGLSEDADEEATVAALYRYLTWTGSRLLCVALGDAIGDRRVQNQPGTVDEYPNWRVPLSGPDRQPVWLEDVLTDRRARDLLEVVSGRR